MRGRVAEGERTVRAAQVVVRLFLVANLAAGALFAGLLVASAPLAGAVAARLHAKYGAGVDAGAVLAAGRVLMVLGIAAAGALHIVFAALAAMLGTVRRGDPFTRANAGRLRRVGWALLGIQLLDLGLGGLVAWLASLRVHVPAWSPALGGWVAVLMAFVLAGVFARGAAMRDDLAMTV